MRPLTRDTSAMRRRRRFVRWLTAALVFLAVAGVAAVKWSGSEFRRLVERLRPTSSRLADAVSAYDKGDWQQAADLSRSLLKIARDDPEVLRTYARASARLERDETAYAIYRNRLGMDRMLPEDLFLLGVMLVRAGKLDQALAVWAKGARGAPEHPDLLSHLARLLITVTSLDEADKVVRRLARLPGWEARGLLLLGEVQGLIDNPKGAVDALREGLMLDPDAKGDLFPAAHYNNLLARSLLQLGRSSDAIAPLEAALVTTNPPGVGVEQEANWLLSRAYLQQKRVADASAALRRAGSYRQDNPLYPEPGPYVGAAHCAACHPKESRAHRQSRHARTFHRGAELLALPLPDRPLVGPAGPTDTLTLERVQDQIRATASAGDSVFTTIVEYAFGVPDRYVTMVGRDESRTYRSLPISSYHTARGVAWDRTSDEVFNPGPVDDPRGAPISVQDGVVRCLYCHVTRSRDFRDPPPETGVGREAADAGIGCERCHGPGGNHLAAIKASFSDRAIVNAGTGSAAAVVTQCADCHVVGQASDARAAPDDRRHVRSPGATLTASRCYVESEGRMSCLTCHDPHRDDDAPASFFEAKCLACHAASTTSQKSCRVNPANDCLNCHMPKVPVAVLHTSLTDHYIRVHREK
jgi:tetratricopeptide (TPR) repeat protein